MNAISVADAELLGKGTFRHGTFVPHSNPPTLQWLAKDGSTDSLQWPSTPACLRIGGLNTSGNVLAKRAHEDGKSDGEMAPCKKVKRESDASSKNVDDEHACDGSKQVTDFNKAFYGTPPTISQPDSDSTGTSHASKNTDLSTPYTDPHLEMAAAGRKTSDISSKEQYELSLYDYHIRIYLHIARFLDAEARFEVHGEHEVPKEKLSELGIKAYAAYKRYEEWAETYARSVDFKVAAMKARKEAELAAFVVGGREHGIDVKDFAHGIRLKDFTAKGLVEKSL